MSTGGHRHGIFKPLEDYITASFSSHECVNVAFTTLRPHLVVRAASEGTKKTLPVSTQGANEDYTADSFSQMDAKTLLLGDFAENGFWWTGDRDQRTQPVRAKSGRNQGTIDRPSGQPSGQSDIVNLKSPHIDWTEVHDWYSAIINAGSDWRQKWNDILVAKFPNQGQDRLGAHSYDLRYINDQIMDAQQRAQRVLLKASETLLKRPGRPLKHPEDIRFLLIILTNPMLYPSLRGPPPRTDECLHSRSRSRSRDRRGPAVNNPVHDPQPVNRLDTPVTSSSDAGPGQHSGIIKRVLGLISNMPNESHHHLVSWLSRFDESQFQQTVDLVGGFVTYRLTRQHGRKRAASQNPTNGLVPTLAGPGSGSQAQLHAALGITVQPPKQANGKPRPVVYNDDWQIKAASRVMAILFSANDNIRPRKSAHGAAISPEQSSSVGLAARDKARRRGQIVPTSSFYNTLLDYSDLVADFEAWESKRGKFAFCQYPFFLSIWAKIQIMEHDARRQMEVKAREAFFNSIMTRKVVNQYLVLKIRRECLVEDSLKGVSEVVGTGGEEIKKGLRIEFTGEEGIDAGGLRKEWFLLLVRDVFNPDHGTYEHAVMSSVLMTLRDVHV